MTPVGLKEGGKFSIVDINSQLRYFNTLLLYSKFQDKNIVAMLKITLWQIGFPN